MVALSFGRASLVGKPKQPGLRGFNGVFISCSYPINKEQNVWEYLIV